ncbi:hypothetical protein GCM10009821_02010 [Aeromicrobium halocynthiae]|uniref:Uncharacterized protein n=1 Tax=Aeromicrobium halocynthiae TaxID=560557 RepID=A0ABN2VQ78_9ACTN
MRIVGAYALAPGWECDGSEDDACPDHLDRPETLSGQHDAQDDPGAGVQQADHADTTGREPAQPAEPAEVGQRGGNDGGQPDAEHTGSVESWWSALERCSDGQEDQAPDRQLPRRHVEKGLLVHPAS